MSHFFELTVLSKIEKYMQRPIEILSLSYLFIEDTSITNSTFVSWMIFDIDFDSSPFITSSVALHPLTFALSILTNNRFVKATNTA